MNNATIFLNAKNLQAVLHLAATKDVRYYLNGVYVEASETETRTTAADGHVLGVMRADAMNGMGGRHFLDLIIPSATVAAALKLLPKGLNDLAVCLADGHWHMEANSARLPFEPIDGKFPEYRRVLPTNTPKGLAAQFDPALLARLGKAAAALKCKHIMVHHDMPGASAMVTIRGCEDFVGVVMPLRLDAKDAPRPSWATSALPGTEPAKLSAVA